MLPEKSPKPTSTHAAPHGLAVIDQISRSLGDDKTVGVLKSSYYETPGLFDSPEAIASVTDKKLLDLDLIVLEPHPNNAEERDVDLISMGTHGRSKLAELVLGSTAKKVVQHAKCPVLTVPRKALSG